MASITTVSVTPSSKGKTIEVYIDLDDGTFSRKRISKESPTGKKMITAIRAIEKEVNSGGKRKEKATANT